MRIRPPGRVIVESDVANGDLVATLRKNLPAARFEVVERVSDSAVRDPDVLEVVRFRGRFLKSCPGTRHYHCCGYRILHFGAQCTLDCSYCILQAYLNQPNLRLFGNVDEMLAELSTELEQNSGRLHRIGTGEFTDSLLLDPFTGLSRVLVPYFARTRNAVLELKTKTDFTSNLKGLDHNGRTITAWSLNSEDVRKREEPKGATLKERLAAARRCAALGYFLAFHFDPLIEYPRWREGYGEILDRLFDAVDPARVVWISLGAFRFMPDLKRIISERHPQSRIPYGEFIRGLDGKMRYFREIRVELYRFMAEKIRGIDPALCVYLCMEGKDIWTEALGFAPDERGGLDAMLDQAVRTRMGVAPGA
ncbi:MAG: spore photoproduct lyase family protein [Syntrophobacteraceae bacterium]